MKMFLYGLLVGIIMGAILATSFFAIQESGFFDEPHSVSKEQLVMEMQCRVSDSQSDWSVEPYAGGQLLITLRQPLKRTRFIADKESLGLANIAERKKLYFQDGGFSVR